VLHIDPLQDESPACYSDTRMKTGADDQFAQLMEKLREVLSRYADGNRWGEVSCIVTFREGECHEVQIAEKETYRSIPVK